MRVCLIGDYSGNPDEGMKNVARSLSRGLRERNTVVLESDVNEVFSVRFFTRLREFSPDIIHYVPGVGWKNIVLMDVLSRITNAKTVISAIHPDVSATPKPLVDGIGPSLIFTQSDELSRSLSRCNVRLATLPNGVDIDRFRPLSRDEKREVRERFDLPLDEYLVLHVGHITHARNIAPLLELQREGVQVVIVASDHFETESEIATELRDAGCRIIERYLEDIERLYAASDCYVFPTREGNTIQSPLSVLEAMACNIPVVTAKHPGITREFRQGGGLQFVETDGEITETVLALQNGDVEVATRERAKRYSWISVANRATEAYARIT